MRHPLIVRTPSWIGAAVLLTSILAGGGALAAWKSESIGDAAAASANQPEPSEAVKSAVVETREYQHATTSIGTVLALRSITLRNELAGTVRQVRLESGQIVKKGELLVGLDVSVENADLRAQEARATLAETSLSRLQRLLGHRAVSVEEVDRARAERDVALAEVARIRAIIGRKTIRAPFRARVGLADVHQGQYLSEGTVLTTLQGIESAANVDFTVAQNVAAGLSVGDTVTLTAGADTTPVPARIVAIDARVDPTTRNAVVRARMTAAGDITPGASVRVRVPVGPTATAVVAPVTALRKGPAGDHVFVIAPDDHGKSRAHLRPVQAGDVLGDEVLILGGLTAGERVAASGSFKLREGALVSLVGEVAVVEKGGR